METEGAIELTRDVEAVRIPSGERLHLPAGSQVIITQALGGSFTVVVSTQPGQFRIVGSDADALGKEPATAGEAASLDEKGEEAVWAQLRGCFDPEIPVNIVDLGLIYDLAIQPREEGGKKVEVKMTLTAVGCGMGPAIAMDAREKILTIPGVEEAEVEVVWDPPWSPDRISAQGRKQLGMD